jgi:hypothetical protein
MATVAKRPYRFPLHQAPDGEQDQARSLDPWGSAFTKRNDSAGIIAEPTAAQVLYGGGKRNELKPTDAFVSDRDWDYVTSVREAYDNARRGDDPGKFREALTRVGGTLQSYPHLEPHLPEGAAQAYRDYRQAIDDDERQNFTANGLRSNPYDRDRMARAAAAAVLGAVIPVGGPSGSVAENPQKTHSNNNVQPGEWWYNQRTGDLDYVDGSEVVRRLGRGYSGLGAGLNNPDMQHVRDTGPIPRGLYTIGGQQDIGRLHGAMRLEPDPANNMYGRWGFLIHGDDGSGAQDASRGCIVLPPGVRRRIAASRDRRLRVY